MTELSKKEPRRAGGTRGAGTSGLDTRFDHTAGHQSEVALLAASDIECRPIEWIWPGWIAAGKLHLLAGAPGTGKTSLALDLAARVSAGRPFPDGSAGRRGHVLIWSGEDAPDDTLVPRLAVAGADLSRVLIVGDVGTGAARRSFDPSLDLAKLEHRSRLIDDITLVILDPVVSAVSGDSHKNGEVRRGLQPVVDFAASVGAAVLGISHFSKGTGGRDPLERVTGSVAFGAVARIVLVTARCTELEKDGERILARAKSNIGPDDGAFSYRLEQGLAQDIEAPSVKWGDLLAGQARDLLSQAEGDQESCKRVDEANAWLTRHLAEGPRLASEINDLAIKAGFSKRTLERSKVVLMVRSMKDGPEGTWRWHLRKEGRQARDVPGIGDLGGLQ